MSTLLAITFGVAVVFGLGATFYFLGEKWAVRSSAPQGQFFPTLHILAIAAAVVGGALAWMAFASDHPSKWRHLTLPFVFVAIVYGYALGSQRMA